MKAFWTHCFFWRHCLCLASFVPWLYSARFSFYWVFILLHYLVLCMHASKFCKNSSVLFTFHLVILLVTKEYVFFEEFVKTPIHPPPPLVVYFDRIMCSTFCWWQCSSWPFGSLWHQLTPSSWGSVRPLLSTDRRPPCQGEWVGSLLRRWRRLLLSRVEPMELAWVFLHLLLHLKDPTFASTVVCPRRGAYSTSS